MEKVFLNFDFFPNECYLNLFYLFTLLTLPSRGFKMTTLLCYIFEWVVFGVGTDHLTCHINLTAGKLYALISSATVNTRLIVFPDLVSCHGQGQESSAAMLAVRQVMQCMTKNFPKNSLIKLFRI